MAIEELMKDARDQGWTPDVVMAGTLALIAQYLEQISHSLEVIRKSMAA